MDVTTTAAVVSTAPNQLQGALNVLYNPVVAIGVGFLGATAKSIYAEIKVLVSAAIDFMASQKGQAVTKDVTQIASDLQQALIDSGHPAPSTVATTLNLLLTQAGQAASLKIPMILALLGVSMLFAAQAKAGIEFGAIAISPSAAGAPVLTVQPSVSSTFYQVNGGILTPETDAVAGIDVLINWGAYQIGAEAAFDYDSETQVDYLAAGIAAGVAPYGDVKLLWRENGLILGYSMPLGVGMQTTP